MQTTMNRIYINGKRCRQAIKHISIQAFITFIIVSFSWQSSSSFAHGVVHQQIDEVSKAIAENENDISHHLRRGRLYIDDGNLELAKKDLTRAIQLGQQQNSLVALDAYYYLAEIALIENKPESAIREAKLFVDKLPNDSVAYVRGTQLLARAYFASKQYREAANAYQSTINAAIFPKPDYYMELAKCYQALLQPAMAIKALQQGQQKRGNLALFDDAIIDIYVDQNQYDNALMHLDSMIAREQRLPYLYLKKSEILLMANKSEQAKQALMDASSAMTTLSPATTDKRDQEQLKQTIEQRMQSIKETTQ